MGKTNSIPFAYQKRGVFYFSRRVPADLQRHYQRDRIVVSLKTSSVRAAGVKASSLAARLDEEWLTLRWTSQGDPLERFRSTSVVVGTVSNAPSLSEAQRFYVDARGQSRPKTFRQAVQRSVSVLTELRGDKSIDAYSRQDANAFRDALLARGLQPASVKRSINTIRALMNFTTKEYGLRDIKAFSGVYFDNDAQPERTRQPIPIEDIRAIQRHCAQVDDEARWLISLVSDTGMRLAEAAGLTKDDIALNDPLPHVIIRPHPWRRLKTRASERLVPLVGSARWAAERALANSGSPFLFPKYCSKAGCNSNSASAALNKWLKPRLTKGGVMHSFRHSFRDRLRAVECPTPIMDRLGGWTLGGIGEGYGNGYKLDVLAKWMEQIA